MGSVSFQINENRQMVTKSADVARAKIGAEKFLAMIGLVVLKQEIGMKNSRATFLIMKPYPIANQTFCNNNLVKNLPVGLMFQGAFKAQALRFPKQIDKATILHF